MNLVAQRGPDDCAVATLAMLLGVTHEDAADRVRVPFHRSRLTEVDIDAALGDAGFAIRRLYHHDPLTNAKRAEWPPAPFAPAHYALVHVAAGFHAVAVDADGTVFDPYNQDRTSLTHPDYRSVDQVVGVWRVSS